MSTDEKYVHEMSEVLFHSNYDSRLEIIRFFFHENREWSEYETFHLLK